MMEKTPAAEAERGPGERLADVFPGRPRFVCPTDDEEAWLENRALGIGASEAAAACGVSQWSTPMEIYLRKRGAIGQVEPNQATKMGTLLEPVVAELFQQEIEPLLCYAPGLFASRELSWLLSTPDGVIDRERLAEFKTINDRYAGDVLGDEDTDDVPFDWICQAQQQMAVTGCEVVIFGVLVGGQDFRRYRVERDADAIERMTNKIGSLWERIQNGDPPELDAGHRSAKALLRDLFPKIKAGDVCDLAAVTDKWLEYEAIQAKRRELEKEADALKAEVFYELGSSEAGKLADGRFLRRKVIHKKPQEATSYIDTRAVKSLKLEAADEE